MRQPAIAGTNAWRLPDEFGISDGWQRCARWAARWRAPTPFPWSARTIFPARRATFSTRPVQDEAFRELDLALKIANEQGIRLIIPLVDNWKWQGGHAHYAGWHGKTRDDFWTDPQIIADSRKPSVSCSPHNTLTGVRYCDNQAILCWETGMNCHRRPTGRAKSPVTSKASTTIIWSWTALARPGCGLNRSPCRKWTSSPRIIIRAENSTTFAEIIRENGETAPGKKPYVVGEFGFVSTAQMQDAMKAIMDTGMAGGLLWSLRFRDRDGGFYWHSEPSGGNKYKAFHWPGSSAGAAYDEINLMALVRSNAFAIRGLKPPPIPVPAPPKLLPISDAAAISWQGRWAPKVTLSNAHRQRKEPGRLPAKALTKAWCNIARCFATSPRQRKWYYRVRAVNESGVSEPSNVIGPVQCHPGNVCGRTGRLEKSVCVQGNVEIKMRDTRKAKEDAQRAAGNAGDALIYRLPTAIKGFRVFVFFPEDVADPKFSISADGRIIMT